METLQNIHPGEVLFQEFLIPMGITTAQLSKDIDIPQTIVAQIINAQRGITDDMAVCLGKFIGTSPNFWLGLQNDYDLEETIKNDRTAC